MTLIEDIVKGLIILGLIGMGTDLFNMNKLVKNAAKVRSESQRLDLREWNKTLLK